MKKIILFLFVVMTIPAVAQTNAGGKTVRMTRAEWRRQIHEQKMVFFVNAMNLTETEKGAFTSLYADYDKVMHASHVKIHEAKKSLGESPSEADYARVVQVIVSEEKVQSDARVNFMRKLNGIISSEKTYKFFKAEKDFKNLLIRDIEKYRKKIAK